MTWNWLNNNDKMMVNWADGQPDEEATTLICGKIDTSSGLWYSTTCDITLPYVCESAQGMSIYLHIVLCWAVNNYHGRACPMAISKTLYTQD